MLSKNEVFKFVLNIASVPKLKLIQIQDDLYSIPEEVKTKEQIYLQERVNKELQRRENETLQNL